ncbi:MAG TPA: hypothetical protein VJR58_15095, partial [Vineibacter sp.]|nr:hypothetical protein [Vineibacter sp.]
MKNITAPIFMVRALLDADRPAPIVTESGVDDTVSAATGVVRNRRQARPERETAMTVRSGRRMPGSDTMPGPSSRRSKHHEDRWLRSND